MEQVTHMLDDLHLGDDKAILKSLEPDGSYKLFFLFDYKRIIKIINIFFLTFITYVFK